MHACFTVLYNPLNEYAFLIPMCVSPRQRNIQFDFKLVAFSERKQLNAAHWQLVTGNYKHDWEETKKHIVVSLSLLRVGATVYLRQSISNSSIFNLMKRCGFTVSAELGEHLFPLCSLLERDGLLHFSSLLFSSAQY